jgi:hypothetical protein
MDTIELRRTKRFTDELKIYVKINNEITKDLSLPMLLGRLEDAGGSLNCRWDDL